MLDLEQRISAPPIPIAAVIDAVQWAEGFDFDISPRSIGWDMHRQYGDAAYTLWCDLMVTRDPWSPTEPELAALWASFDRPKHETDSLLIDDLAVARDAGWRVAGPAIAATEAILDALAKGSGAERASPLQEWRQYLSDNRYTGPIMTNTDLLTSSRHFINEFVRPEYLIDGALQRRYFYSMTAQTGVGKTAIAMRWMGHVVKGESIGETEVTKGAVLYLAGENPDDVRARWLVLSREMDIDPDTKSVTWVVGVKDLAATAAQFSAEVISKGLEFAFVVVDTAAAFATGDDENSNNQAGNYARLLRSLTKLPGGPCVVALCHPTKRAADDDLMPRGAGAFMAEVDGNMAVTRKDGGLLTVAPFGKFRGDMSWLQQYEISAVKDHPMLTDARGRQMASVLARPVGSGAAATMEKRGDADVERVLSALDKAPSTGFTPTDIARLFDWTYGNKGEPHSVKAGRILKRLLRDKLAKEAIGKWRLTPAGQKYLNDADRAKAASLPPAPPMPH